MHVQWKVLISLGLMFWTLMCITEYYFGGIISPGEFREIEMPLDLSDDSSHFFKFSSEFGWWETAMYIIFSFGSSLSLCFITKLIKLYMKRRKEKQFELMVLSTDCHQDITSSVSCEDLKLLESRNSKSRIPVPVSNVNERRSTSELSSLGTGISTMQTGYSFTTRTNILHAVKDFATVKLVDSNSTQRFEKDCAKLKDAMVMLQANSMKEHAALSKKLELICREKRDLAKQLGDSQKENSLAKLQLDEILSDRTLLIRRLDCATREIKLNTTSKQMTLEKLEEAVSNSADMRTKIAQLSKDKGGLEVRLKEMEVEYAKLIEQRNTLAKQSESVKLLWDEHEKNEDLRKAERVKEDIDITQSERDMEKVQLKLCDLEKSLEKLRVSPRRSQHQPPGTPTDLGGDGAMQSKFSQEDLQNINESLALCHKSSNNSSTTTTAANANSEAVAVGSDDDDEEDDDDDDEIEEEDEDQEDEESTIQDNTPEYTIEELCPSNESILIENEPFLVGTSAAAYVKDKLASCFNMLHNLHQPRDLIELTATTPTSSSTELSGAMDDSDDSVVTMEESDSDFDLNKCAAAVGGIVSNSPAFQKFLLKTIGPPDNNNQTTTTNNNTPVVCSN